MCVMLVEDEPNIRMLTAEMLVDAGHTIVEFSTAADARAYASLPGNWLTTVLTDINMPGERTVSTLRPTLGQRDRKQP